MWIVLMLQVLLKKTPEDKVQPTKVDMWWKLMKESSVEN